MCIFITLHFLIFLLLAGTFYLYVKKTEIICRDDNYHMLTWQFSVAKLYFVITSCLWIFFLSILIDIVLTKLVYSRKLEK